jgi:hypothetical protein
MRLRKDHKPDWLEAAAAYLRYPVDLNEILGGIHGRSTEGVPPARDQPEA